MDSTNFLNYSIAGGFLVLVVFISYAFYNLAKSLKEATAIFSKVDSITKDVESLKDVVKSGILYLVSMFSTKRGVKNK